MSNSNSHHWPYVMLQEIADISSGGTPSRSEPKYWNGSIPWVTTGEINFGTIYDTSEKISDIGLKHSSARLYPVNTLLMAMYGQGKTRGRIAILGIKASTNQACAVIKIKGENDYRFFFQYFSHQYENIRKLSNGGSQKNLSLGLIKSIKVPLPTPQEQDRIIVILETWDKAIKQLEKKIELKKNARKGLMHRLLTGKLRLPGFTEKWKLIRLGDVVERVKRKNNIGNTNVLTISAQDGLVNQEAYFYKQIASDNLEKYTLLEKGDFAYNKSYSQGYPMGAIKRLKMYKSGVVSSLYICFKGKGNADTDFLDCYFDAGLFNQEIGKIAQEGARNHGLLNIGIDEFFEGEIRLPDLKEQQTIAKVLLASETEISLLMQSLKKLKEQKAYLLSHLITGRIRTPENMPISKH